VLRDVELRDQPAVRQLILAGMRERWGGRYDGSANPDTDDIWTSYVTRGGEVVVWDEDGAVVATGTLLPEPDGGGRIVRMSVAPGWRRRGLGRQVVAELSRRAEKRALHTLRVTTDTPWIEAVALYEACGFAIVEQTDEATHLAMVLG
jgi:ribosomal protein S18 acetylase RimI-like enzyme